MLVTYIKNKKIYRKMKNKEKKKKINKSDVLWNVMIAESA